ncbi:hypothetical protein DPMN_046521 [Dreissena polymorpha]|uniref:Uncharacterized protein n=1 Tax=Dreissena polymorpha TaxID=45954 RepID=A0A9D4D623_DREPO|nr:hypothetical protein DPMN_046521 [Dreissena polymorpha]
MSKANSRNIPMNHLRSRKEILPKIVQLGHSLPARFPDELDIWTPVEVVDNDRNIKTARTLPSRTREASSKCRKYRNLFEYSQHNEDTFELTRGLWKMPSIGNNFLPFRKCNSRKTSDAQEDIALYRPKFHRCISRLVHEHTVILPPIETSERVKSNVFDPSNLHEKIYVFRRYKGTGQRERFVRDEMHVPDIYPQCFTCRECQKQYTSEVYSQSLTKRKSKSPACLSILASYLESNKTVPTSKSGKRRTLQRQHCDVLGERYCKSCKELRNKGISRQIENSLINNNKLANVHYTQRY